MSGGLVIEPARFAVTGAQGSGLAIGLRMDYILSGAAPSDPLDAPQYTPAGGLQVLPVDAGYAVAAVLRAGVLA